MCIFDDEGKESKIVRASKSTSWRIASPLVVIETQFATKFLK